MQFVKMKCKLWKYSWWWNLKGICQDFENFVNVLWIRSFDSCRFNMWKKFWNWFYSFWAFVLWFFRPNISLKIISKKINSGNSVTTKWFSYSLVKHEQCCHFSIEGNQTWLSLWRHTLFWMGAFGRQSLTRNLSVFRMCFKKLRLKCSYFEKY